MSNTYTNQELRDLDLIPTGFDYTGSEVNTIQNFIRAWVKLKRYLTVTGELPDKLTDLNNAKTNYLNETIDEVEFEYEVLKVGVAWRNLCKQKLDEDNWDFFVNISD